MWSQGCFNGLSKIHVCCFRPNLSLSPSLPSLPSLLYSLSLSPPLSLPLSLSCSSSLSLAFFLSVYQSIFLSLLLSVITSVPGSPSKTFWLFEQFMEIYCSDSLGPLQIRAWVKRGEEGGLSTKKE